MINKKTLLSLSVIALLFSACTEEEKTTAAAKEDEGGYNKYQGTK